MIYSCIPFVLFGDRHNPDTYGTLVTQRRVVSTIISLFLMSRVLNSTGHLSLVFLMSLLSGWCWTRAFIEERPLVGMCYLMGVGSCEADTLSCSVSHEAPLLFMLVWCDSDEFLISQSEAGVHNYVMWFTRYSNEGH